MSDLPYDPVTNTTPFSPREKWISYTKGTHFHFIRGSDLGPLQKNRAFNYYSIIHWEGACSEEKRPGWTSIHRTLTDEPDPVRMAKIYELIDAAWEGIGWKISKKTYVQWAKAMGAIQPLLETMRPQI